MECFHKEESKNAMLDILKDKSFQKEYKLMRKKLHLFDGCDHFLKKINEVSALNYKPSDLDILMCRRKSVGASRIDGVYNGNIFNFIDVGGQRSERKVKFF
jgi:hypothetical protein